MTRLLVIMGSGETTPTMVSTHRRVLDAVGPQPEAVLLDTPYGFQENAEQVTGKARAYFAASVGVEVAVASLRRADAVGPVRLEALLAQIRGADWVFTGPGSPTYLARQWLGTPVPGAFVERLQRAGATVFASAAAVALGALAVPVYEIYKAGAEPHWVVGLDLLSGLGLDAVCIPHFDNGDGGDAFDTRFCYLGATRLAALEALLPEGTWVLGVDEHTALVIDLDRRTARVEGRGGVTVRLGGHAAVFPTGSDVTLDELVAATRGAVASATPSLPPSAGEEVRVTVPPRFDEAVARCAAAFDEALAAGQPLDAAEVTITLEQVIRDWSTDVEEADSADRARAELRRQVGALARIAQAGLHEHRDLVAPHVETLLALRRRARDDGRYDDADAIRAALVDAGVEVRDTPDGVQWTYRDPLAGLTATPAR